MVEDDLIEIELDEEVANRIFREEFQAIMDEINIEHGGEG